MGAQTRGPMACAGEGEIDGELRVTSVRELPFENYRLTIRPFPASPLRGVVRRSRSLKVTQVGAWSLAPSLPRNSVSTPAAFNLDARAGLSSKKSIRNPALRLKASAFTQYV